MSTRAVTARDFDRVIQQPGIVLVDWWAPWCGPCRAFAPIYERVASDHPDVVFAKIDTEVERTLASRFGIRAIPTLMVFRDGILVFEQAGALPQAVLGELVRRVRALDMASVRAQTAPSSPR